MSYFADSVWNYIAAKIDRVRKDGSSGRRVLVTVPALPEEAMLTLAETLTSRCMADTELEIAIKIAEVAVRDWSAAGKSKAERFGWIDGQGNLTNYRNAAAAAGKTTLTVLCGADRITDAASLDDFHGCNLEVIWKEEMKGSFQGWVGRKLKSDGLEAVESKDLKEFDRLLVPLCRQGKADLLSIDGWLSTLDLSSADSSREVRRIMLGSLEDFSLPKFTGFPWGQKRASLARYIDKASEFFSYTLFLDAKEREKALRTLDRVREAVAEDQDIGVRFDDVDVLGPYANIQALLEGLKNYIGTEDPEDRERLRRCDFLTIVDGILKFRLKNSGEKERKETLHKLSGGPVEVVLHAVWWALREFSRDKQLAEAKVERIEIRADRFKHDYEKPEDEEEIDAAVDRSESARNYLRRLLGGVDDLVARRLELLGKEGNSMPVSSQLWTNEVPCTYAKTAEPQLEFTVKLAHSGAAEPFERRFAWRLPEIQSYRLADSLLLWARNALKAENGTWKLPAFHLPYYEEMLRATDDEETRRVMLHCVHDARPEDRQLINLLQPEWLAARDVLLEPLKLLSERYAAFVETAFQEGLHSTLFSDQWVELRKAHAAACRVVVQDESGTESQIAPMLMRAFLLVQQRGSQYGAAWATEGFERSGIVTVLHPALLEMLEAHVLFLFSCFNAAVKLELNREDRRKAFAENIWTGYVDLGSIQSPLMGLLQNEDQSLDTNVRGHELIHLIGSPSDSEAPLSTRLLIRYDNGHDDEPVGDAEMFRESRESKLLYRLMTDYFRLHPHARDGLNLAVFRNGDIQPVIAAVHQYLSKLADERDGRYYVLTPERRKPYAIGVTIFTESGDDVDVARWIEQWRERWEAAETETKLQAYRSCRFAVAHRIIEARQFGSFQRLINDTFEADIAVLYDFVAAGQGGKFAEVTPFDVTQRTLKFPILEKSCCAIRHPTDSGKRSRVISNRQFTLGTLHAEVLHRLKNPGVQPGKEFVILGTGDFAPWRGVVDAFHAKAEWVICVDPNMDERLIKIPAGGRSKEREIIGFGSGVGSHGQANYTISTEQFSLADIQVRLAASVQEVYGGCGWGTEECGAVAKGVLAVARELSGLSLVRATGVGHYIRDFMAYSLTRKMLRESRPVLCDHLVSLDAYRHWFDLADDERRPDLMWLTAWLEPDKRVRLRIHLIECKLAQQSDEHLVKARAQINNGLRVLIPALAAKSSEEGNALLEDNRPDQRYWWLQLHRLVTSKAEITENQRADVLSALERLAEGDYIIDWDASVFAFWTDDTSGEAKRVGSWKPVEGMELTAEIYTMGSEFVGQLAVHEQGASLNWPEWQHRAQVSDSNVCRTLDDIELPVNEEDDEDVPAWGDPSESHEETGVALEPTVPEPAEPEGAEPVLTPPQAAPALAPLFVAPPPEPEPAVTVDAPAPEPPFGPVTSSAIPTRILLGETANGAKPVYWEFGHPGLANRHMLVFGTSGMGKTYAIQCLLCELGRAGQNSLVIDYTDGFIPSKLEPATKACLNAKQHFIQQEPLPINPFKAQVSEEAGMTFRDTPMTIAKRVAAIFKSVYELGNQQFPVLIDAISDGLAKDGDGFTMAKLLEVLQSYTGDEIHTKSTVQTTFSKLKPFIQSNPFAPDTKGIGWQELFTDAAARCQVFQFFKIDRHSARALIEFVLWDLYGFVSTFGNKQLPRVVVLDEVQNLDLGPDAPVAKYLTEGRKHGLALITATQTVKGVGGVNDARVSRLFQAEHKVFFKPTENEMREHAQLLHNAISNVSVQDWATRLASLQVGECWSLGRSLNEAANRLVFQAQRIKITSLEKRGFNG